MKAPRPRRPGRPRLGVIAREVTLLPLHWEWLAAQSGGTSGTLRRLVDMASHRSPEDARRIRRSQAVAYKFISALAAAEPTFDQAAQALFAGRLADFDALTANWPADVRDVARYLAAGASPVVPALPPRS